MGDKRWHRPTVSEIPPGLIPAWMHILRALAIQVRALKRQVRDLQQRAFATTFPPYGSMR